MRNQRMRAGRRVWRRGLGWAAALCVWVVAAPAAGITISGGNIFLDRGVEILDDTPADFFMDFQVVAIADTITVDVNGSLPGGCPTQYALTEHFSNWWLGGSGRGAFASAVDRNDCFPTGSDAYTIRFEESGETPIEIDLDFLPPAAPDGTTDLTTIDGTITPANMAMNVSLQPTFEWDESTCTNCRVVCQSGGATPADPSMLDVQLFEPDHDPVALPTAKAQDSTEHTLSNEITPLPEGETFKFSVKVFNRILVTDTGDSCPGDLDGFNVNYGMSQSRIDAVTFTTIPEPGGLLLVGAGLTAVAVLRRRRLAE